MLLVLRRQHFTIGDDRTQGAGSALSNTHTHTHTHARHWRGKQEPGKPRHVEFHSQSGPPKTTTDGVCLSKGRSPERARFHTPGFRLATLDV